MYKIISIVGTRPQFIKSAMLSKSFSKNNLIQEITIHTGQHYDKNMSDVFFEQLQLPRPKYYLNINKLPHGEMIGRMMIALEPIFISEKPDAVIIFGDTNTALAPALVASKHHIKIMHVEAGLRSYNKLMPEEINRVLTDHMSDCLFCPSQKAVRNLEHEGITKNVFNVGDIMYDATLFAMDYLKHNNCLLDKFSFIKSEFAILTVHREASVSIENLRKILEFVNEYSVKLNMKTIFLVHPRTYKVLEKIIDSYQSITQINAVGYFEMQGLLSKASLVFTDSGGMQKEAYFHRVPCITLRSETEWNETVESGWNCLWGSKKINFSQHKTIDYGDGHTADKISNIIFSQVEMKYANTVAIC